MLVSKQSSTTFSDKSQIWADNASSSRFFGTVYVCWAAFVAQEKGNAAPAPLQVAVSRDGGDTWTQRQISAAANNGQRNPRGWVHDPHRQLPATRTCSASAQQGRPVVRDDVPLDQRRLDLVEVHARRPDR